MLQPAYMAIACFWTLIRSRAPLTNGNSVSHHLTPQLMFLLYSQLSGDTKLSGKWGLTSWQVWGHLPHQRKEQVREAYDYGPD